MRTFRTWAGYAVMLVLIAACSSSAGGSRSLADWAAGRWSCVLEAETPVAPASRLDVDATVSIDSDTSGRVELEWPDSTASVIGSTDEGEWTFRDGSLEVRWDRLGPTHARTLTLDTERFEIRGDGERGTRGDWVTVEVDRDRGAVTFEFTMPGTGRPGHLSCRRG